uniref:Leucine-rich repeat and coiled-coil domain-containing protein 1 n=1 Tax=Oreochromis niloticus TaxID=8128 RepID=A0A669C2N9_ORENI
CRCTDPQHISNSLLFSLLDIPLIPTVTSLNLHCNHIPRIEGLTSAWHLRHLDLSSNCISKIEGLSSLTSLRTLNLSCNLITKVEALNGLVNLTRLNLSYNQINDLSGLLYLHGTEYKLKHLSLHSNHLDSIDHLLQCLLGIQGLREVTLSQDGRDNPVCRSPGYREIVLQSLPQVSVLDGLNRLGNPSPQSLSSLCDIPGLEDYVDLLLSSDTSHNEVRGDAPLTTPRIDQLLTQFRQRSATSEVITDPVTQPEPPCTQPVRSTVTDKGDPVSEERIRKLEHQMSQLIQQVHTFLKINFFAYVPCCFFFVCFLKNNDTFFFLNVQCVFTLGIHALCMCSAQTIVEERDQERERRWKAEQAVRKLTEELKCLQTKVSEEKDLQSMALHTTDRLKELLLKERSGHSELQARVEEMEGRCRSLTQQLEQARSCEEQHKTSLGHSALTGWYKTCADLPQIKRQQELQNKAAALKRELDIQRASVRQHKDKLQQLHELLAAREQEHRKQLELRLQPGGADFRDAVAKEVASVEERHSHKEAELQEKLAEGRKQYTALEDEFRMALTIEAARFSEVKEACDQMTAELMELKATLAQSQERERKSGSLVQELTAMVKEQKSRISELIKAKRDAVTDLKSRLHSLEAEVGQDRRLGLQLELLKKDKARLLSQLTAQESVIDGLRAERKIWGQELAQQGASLAQDRGRLEARLEVLSAELEAQRKQNEKDNDTLRIKAKIMDDQTETIRRLKESLQERDDQIRRLKEEAAKAQKRLQEQLEEETTQQAELKERVEHLSLRKEELKQQLEDKEAELEQVKRVYSESTKKWQEKADLLTRLESQVKRMKENFDSRERLLLEEREKATEKLHYVDDAFRRQLESVQAAHQAELLRLANEKQQKIEEANQKVFEVEEEMRQLLEETETNKRIMEEKMKRLSSVLKDF